MLVEQNTHDIRLFLDNNPNSWGSFRKYFILCIIDMFNIFISPE